MQPAPQPEANDRYNRRSLRKVPYFGIDLEYGYSDNIEKQKNYLVSLIKQEWPQTPVTESMIPEKIFIKIVAYRKYGNYKTVHLMEK